MIEILKSFEQVASRFSPVVLIVPGLAMVALGLVAWLAGMCLRRLVPALVGAAAGGLISFVLSRQSLPVYVLAAGGGAAFGAILPRLFLAVLLAALGLAVAFAFAAGTHLAEGKGTLFGRPDPGEEGARFTVEQSLDAVRAHAFDVVDRAQAAARALKPAPQAMVGAAGLGLLVAGLVFGRLAGALTCSVVGTALIFAGLVTLLLFKGSAPITLVQRQGAFYGLVLLGMVAFGTLEQLVLCPAPRREPKAGAGKSRFRRQGPERSWRNR